MMEGNILDHTNKAFQQGPAVRPLLKQPKNMAISTLHNIQQILVIASNHFSIMRGTLPILIGDCGDFYLGTKLIVKCNTQNSPSYGCLQSQ